METGPDSPEVVRERATSLVEYLLVEYLLAVRALLEKPARTVPGTDAFWQADLPAHPAVVVGPADPTGPWLRVGRPAPPADPMIPPALVPDLVWDLSYVDTPRLRDERPDRKRELDAWLDAVWQPWAVAAAAAEAARELHDKLYDLRYRLDVDVSRVELVWGSQLVGVSSVILCSLPIFTVREVV